MKNTLFKHLLVVFLSVSFVAQANQKSKLTHSTETITVDGDLTENIWQRVTPLDVNIEVNPDNGAISSLITKAYLFEDGEALYVGIYAEDPNPEEIKATYRKRDDIGSQDRIVVTLDTFNKSRRAFQFAMNPVGVQLDQIFNTNGGSNSSWNTLWDGAAKITENGYQMEFKLPYSSLRFPEVEGRQVWRIEVERYIPRSGTLHLASKAKPRSNNCFLCMSREIIGAQNVKSDTNMQFVPTMLASQSSNLDDNNMLVDGDVENEFGFDYKWAVTADNILNVTVNPDFSQVEADASEITVNNTFSPSFPEKRPFFLEGSSYFKTAQDAIIHTRNIVAPEYGSKLTGQHKQHNYAVLAAKDTVTSFILPGVTGSEAYTLSQEGDDEVKSNNLVARYNYNFSGLSNLGVLMTSKSANDYNNDVYVVDGNFKPNSYHHVSYEVAHTKTQNPLELMDYRNSDDDTENNLERNQSGTGYQLGYTYRQAAFNIGGKVARYDRDYRADLSNRGSVGTNYKRVSGGYDWYNKADGLWTKIGTNVGWSRNDIIDGDKYREEFYAKYFVNGFKQLWWHQEYQNRETLWNGEYYDEHSMNYWFAIDPIQSIRVRWIFDDAKTIDYANSQSADKQRFTVGADWRAFGHFTGSIKYIVENMDVAKGDLYDLGQFDLRGNWQFNLAHSMRFVFKFTDIDRTLENYNVPSDYDKNTLNMSTQLIYSYSPNPFTVLYAGYSDSQFEDDEFKELKTNNRNIFLKLSYGFQL